MKAVNRIGEGLWSEPCDEVLTEVGLPDTIEPRPVPVAKTPHSITLLFRVPVDMMEIAFTRKFLLQADGLNTLYDDDITEKQLTSLRVLNDSFPVRRNIDKQKGRYFRSTKGINMVISLKDAVKPARQWLKEIEGKEDPVELLFPDICMNKIAFDKKIAQKKKEKERREEAKKRKLLDKILKHQHFVKSRFIQKHNFD